MGDKVDDSLRNRIKDGNNRELESMYLDRVEICARTNSFRCHEFGFLEVLIAIE